MDDTKILGAYDEVEVEDTLLLKDFEPRSMLEQEVHIPEKARFPAVDAHVHLDENEERDVSFYLKLMDQVGIEACVSIQELWGEDLLGYLKRFSGNYPERFKVVCWPSTDRYAEPDGIRKMGITR